MKKPTEIEFKFVVNAPKNNYKFVVSQRLDGPFENNTIMGRGHYYTSLEKYTGSDGIWEYVKGSADTWNDYETACNQLDRYLKKYKLKARPK